MRLLLAAAAAALITPAVADDACTPETPFAAAEGVVMPKTFPSAIPLADDYKLLSADEGEASEYDPYGYARIEYIVEGSREEVFEYYQKALVDAGYRIVMWENDANMGLRFRGDGIESGDISIADYDCRPVVGVSIMLLP